MRIDKPLFKPVRVKKKKKTPHKNHVTELHINHHQLFR